MGWVIALAIIVLLAILPLGVSVKYDSGGPLIRLIAGPIRLTVFPRKRKLGEKKKAPKKKKEPKPAKPAQPKPKPAKTSGGKLRIFFPWLRLHLTFCGTLNGNCGSTVWN